MARRPTRGNRGEGEGRLGSARSGGGEPVPGDGEDHRRRAELHGVLQSGREREIVRGRQGQRRGETGKRYLAEAAATISGGD